MDFKLSEEQKSLVALTRDFCEREDVTRFMQAALKMQTVKDVDELRSNFPWEMMENLDKVGLRQLAVPEKYGGAGICKGGHATRILVMEEATYRNQAVSTLLSIYLRYCSDFEAQATPEQQDVFFTDFMKNKRSSIAVAQSEPEGMTDIVLGYDEPAGTTLRVKGIKDGDDWIVNGSKMFCTAGGVADKILVSVRTDEKAHISKGMTWMWVNPMEMEGISMNINRSALLNSPSGDVQLHFDNVRVPKENIVGALNDSHEIRASRIGTKIIHWIQVVAMSQKILEQLIMYSKERVQGGKPIIEHSSVACMIGEAASLVESARALIYKTACEYDDCELSGSGILPAEKGFMCAYLVKRMMMRITEMCCDIWGGVGWEHGMPLPEYAMTTLILQHPGMSPSINLMKATRAIAKKM